MKDGLSPVKVIRCIITLEPVVWVIIHTDNFFSKMDSFSSGLRGARFATLDKLFSPCMASVKRIACLQLHGGGV